MVSSDGAWLTAVSRPQIGNVEQDIFQEIRLFRLGCIVVNYLYLNMLCLVSFCCFVYPCTCQFFFLFKSVAFGANQ